MHFARYRQFRSITPISPGCTLPGDSPLISWQTSVRSLHAPTEASGEDTGVPISGGAVAYSVLGRPLASRGFQQQREYVEALDQRWSSDTRGADLRPARQRRTASR